MAVEKFDIGLLDDIFLKLMKSFSFLGKLVAKSENFVSTKNDNT